LLPGFRLRQHIGHALAEGGKVWLLPATLCRGRLIVPSADLSALGGFSSIRIILLRQGSMVKTNP
jgi:hypothetical protein